MSRVVFESPSARARVDRAAEWLGGRREPHVTIVAASIDAAGEVARSAIARSDGIRASLGWQRTTLGALAASLARTELARLGLAPASALALEALCARVVHDHGDALGRLAPIRERPGLPRALARTLGELRLARAENITDPALARLLAAYEAELEATKLADRARTLAIATEVARGRNGLDHGRGALLLLDVPLRSRAERDLVEALVEKASAALAVVPTGDDRALELASAALGVTKREEHAPDAKDGPLAQLWSGLFGPTAAEGTKVPAEAVTVLSAPGESRECVEIARLVLAEAAQSRTPLDRMAVLLRAPRYGAHVVEAFRRAKIPVYFARGTTRPDPSGRAFLALIACAAEQLSARRFSEYLSLGEVPDEGKDGAPPLALPRADRVAAPDDETLHALIGAGAAEERPEQPDEALLTEPEAPPVAEEDQGAAFGTLRTPRHWERLLVEAAVIGEAGRWRNRLAGLAAKLAGDIDAYDKKDETALADFARRELAALEALQRFALPLVDDLAALPKSATWGEWIEKLGALASRALRRPGRVLAVLGELEPMSKVDNVGISEVRLVLEPRLSQLRIPELGRRYGKVFVATTDEARGLAFDVVFVPGLAEKIFPQKVVEDPLLLDAAREKLSPDLPTNKDRTDDERLALRLAVGAAERRVVLSYPRLDVEQARPRTPSFYGLEVLRVAEGQLGDFEHLAEKAASTAEARIGWPAPVKREDAIDEAEYDLALLKNVLEKPENEVNGEGRYLVDANPHLSRALRFRWMRWDSEGAPPFGRPRQSAARGARGDPRARDRQALVLADGAPELRRVSLPLPPLRGAQARAARGARRDRGIGSPHQGIARPRGAVPPPHAPSRRRLAPCHLEHARGGPRTARRHPPRGGGRVPRTPPPGDRARVGRRDHRHRRRPPRVAPPHARGARLDAGALRALLRPQGPARAGREEHRRAGARSTSASASAARSISSSGGRTAPSAPPTTRRARSRRRRTRRSSEAARSSSRSSTRSPSSSMFPGSKVVDGVLYYCTSAGNFEQVRVPLDDNARASAHMVAKTVSDALVKGFLPTAPNIEKKGYSACTWCDFRPVCGPYEEIRTKKKPQAPLKVLAELRKRK